MTTEGNVKSILLVSGMSGAGKSTALKTLEDLGWEVVDNLPLMLLERLMDAPPAAGAARRERPLAIGIDSRTRGFDAAALVQRIKILREHESWDIETLYLDCSGAELERRYAETRRRHPLAEDRPAADGIARERELTEPLRRWSTQVIDTTAMSVNELQQEIRARYGNDLHERTVLTILSFGFSRGVPRNADLMFDMRFLRNPHWIPELKPLTGRDQAVADYIANDPAYDEAVKRIEELLLLLLPRYANEGKAYVTIAFGCTGGQHRSVHICECIGERLRAAGFSPMVTHRDLGRSSGDATPENNYQS